MNEINDYLSKSDEEIAKSVVYRVYGMPGPLFVENEITPTPGPEPSFNNPFYVENITDETETLTITSYNNTGEEIPSYVEIALEYSTNGRDWSVFGTTGSEPLTMTLNPDDKIYLRASIDTWTEVDIEGDNIYKYNTITGMSKVGGNIMSLLYGEGFTGNETIFPAESYYNFARLFIEGTSLLDASELILPATELTMGCYESMFARCTSLTTAPSLPATTLADSCYGGMFYGCESLTIAPQLPATILSEDCYLEMFHDCTLLTSAPQLPATVLAIGCYDGMFMNCTSLTTAPVLPATNLSDYCYQSMFNGCTSLNEVTIYADDISAENCLYHWLNNVAPQGTFNNMGSAGYPSGPNGNPWDLNLT